MPDRLPEDSRHKPVAAPHLTGVPHPTVPGHYYRRLWYYAATITGLISLTPLIVMTFVNSRQYERALAKELSQTITRLVSTSRASMTGFIEEHRAALAYVAATESYENLCQPEKLNQILLSMNQSFGGFVDLGVIDSDGNQQSYAGHYELEGKNYSDQDWFHEVRVRGIYVSDVFLGYRNVPHFVIAVRTDQPGNGGFYILRATIDTDLLVHLMSSLQLKSTTDAFLMNTKGVLQTSSRLGRPVLSPSPVNVPAYSPHTEVVEVTDTDGVLRLMGYGYVADSPFIFVVLKDPAHMMESWLYLRRDILILLGISIVLIVIIVAWRTTYLVNRIRHADHRRDRALHDLEYSAKMASIGRMAAGVAHEINNPLAIIGENAGLLNDLMAMSDKPLEKDRVHKITARIIQSVERCSAITHRLLGFARHMGPVRSQIALRPLLDEVLSFQDKEVDHRGITVEFQDPGDLPTIESDRGKLQQVFLNILSNAFAAVDDGGRIDIVLDRDGPDAVTVTISDDGHGIPEDHLRTIFEPFFSTKGEYGTGLGLSLTLGIVQRLGGTISVESELGHGASFIVRLPIDGGGQ